jgi:hypothetical protein
MVFRSTDTPKDQEYAFNIEDWVWRYLHKHPRLLAVSVSHAEAIKLTFRSIEMKKGNSE